jgi:predicted nucleic acid-binding protein
MIVADASAILEILLRTDAAERVELRLFASEERIHVPHLLDLEVAQVLRRYTLRGDLTPARAIEALEVFGHLPLVRYPHEPLLGRIWDLKHNLTAYDAAYVVLAEALGANLITRDAALASAGGHSATVELL